MGKELQIMKKLSIDSRTIAHVLMTIRVIFWGFDYIPAKWALKLLGPTELTFLKYGMSFVFLSCVKICMKNWNLIRIKDIPLFLACSFFGQVLYYQCEYNAMDYIPVSLLTIILAFVPVFSIITERVLYKRRSNALIVTGTVICIVGIFFIVGSDFHTLFAGKGIGYLLAFGAVFLWNTYNFITSSLKEYDTMTLTATQTRCTALMTAPFALHTMPPLSEFTPEVFFSLFWICIVSSGLGYIVSVYCLQVLGPTTVALYSDFLPVATAFFGALFLHESITVFQAICGVVVIISGFVVIFEKGKLDAQQ